jgi:hypothetical protein
MIQAYFDESASGDELLCVSGYAAPEETWNAFSALWLQRLGSDGIRFFHMKEFANGTGQFREFSPDKRETLINDLLGIILDHMQFGVGVSINPREYDELTTDRFRSQKGSAYTFCTQACVSQVVEWLDRHRQEGVVQYVFDRGHRNESQAAIEIGKLNHPLLRHEYKFDSVVFGSDKQPGMEPLQAADILAYETNQQRRNVSAGRPMRMHLKKLLTQYHESLHIDRQHISGVVEELRTMMEERPHTAKRMEGPRKEAGEKNPH